MSTNKVERNRKGGLTLADYSTWYVDKAMEKEINSGHLSTHQKREFPACRVLCVGWLEGILRTAVWKKERGYSRLNSLTLLHAYLSTVSDNGTVKKTGRVFDSV